MEPITIRFEQDELERLEKAAEDAGFSNRSEYIRHVLRNRSEHKTNTTSNTSEYDVEAITHRLDDLEQRVDELEAENTAKPQNDESDAQSDSSPETMDTPHPDEEMAGSAGGPTPESTHVDDELEAAWDEWIEAEGPTTVHGKEMMRDLLQQLREKQIVTTAELREPWFEEWGDAYSDSKDPKKSLWDSITRHLKEAPGVEDPGTGHWRYAGDDELREELEEHVTEDT